MAWEAISVRFHYFLTYYRHHHHYYNSRLMMDWCRRNLLYMQREKLETKVTGVFVLFCTVFLDGLLFFVFFVSLINSFENCRLLFFFSFNSGRLVILFLIRNMKCNSYVIHCSNFDFLMSAKYFSIFSIFIFP